MGLLCFCFPYRGVGGVPLLFVRLAATLVARGHRVALIDYADGFMARHRPEGVELITYVDDGLVELPPDALAVFQAMTPWSIFPGLRLPRSCRLFFWNCHPFNLVPTLPGARQFMQGSLPLGRLVLSTVLRPYRDVMRRLVALLQSRNSLVFMDSANLETTRRYLGVPLPRPLLLPIPASGSTTASPRPLPAESGIRLAWVGRLVDFKFNILDYTLRELDRVQPSLQVPLSVTIVGAGEYAEQLRRRVAGLRNVAVELVDYVAPGALDDFLLARADVLLAMGTSALEGAKLGIPTLLLDVAYRRVPEGYVFRWLDQSRGYSLGDVLSAEHIVPGNDSLAACLRQVLADYPELSGRMASYFRKNHALEVVADRFSALALSATCTWGDVVDHGLSGRGALYSVFDTLRKLVRK